MLPKAGTPLFLPLMHCRLNCWNSCNIKGLEHVSMEQVCSGFETGHSLILYAFLKETGKHPEPEWLAKKLTEGADMAPVIFGAAQTSELCAATLHFFVPILAVEAGNHALKILATGGIYLGGIRRVF